MDSEIEQQLSLQQQQQQQLQNQITVLQQQLANQEITMKNIKTTRFDLSPDQIIRNFNEIQPFSGEDSYKLKSFLKSIVDTESLCGINNEELKQYCLKKIINTKIIGNARNTIMEIPENQRTWENVLKQLKLRYRPKKTIHQLLYNAKEIKVFSLKDIFIKLNKYKSECSEICDFDDEDNFTYYSIDKELVQILKSKLVPLVQIQIDTTKSLFELDNILCKSEIYLSEDIIKTEFRMNRNKEFNFKTNNKTYYQNKNSYRNNNIDSIYNHKIYNNNNNRSGQFRTQDYRNNGFNSGQFRTQDYRNNGFNSGQFRTQEHRNNGFNSGQFRRQFNDNRTGQIRNNTQQPMEIDNINQVNPLNQEVNFINPTPSTSYR